VRGLLPRFKSDAHRYGYEKEILLLVGDWYHWPAKDILAWYMAPANIGLDVCSKFRIFVLFKL
jgi:hypothetical protein